MPDFANLEAPDYAAPTAGNFSATRAITPEMQAEAARLTQPGEYGWFKTLGGAAALGIPDVVDTMLASIPGLSKVTGVQRGDFNEKVLQAIDMPGLTQFYRERQGAVEVGSSIYGIVAAEGLTRGALRAAPSVLGFMRATPYARRIMALDTEYKSALAAVRQIDSDLASRGLMGAAQYVESAKVSDFIIGAGDELIESSTILSRAAAASKARRLGATQMALRTSASEATIAVTLNENSFLFDADNSTNIMFAALGIGIGGALGSVSANYAMRKFVNSDRMQRAYAGALDPTGTERARLDSSGLVQALKLTKDEVPFFGNMFGALTDRVTSFMVAARTEVKEGLDVSTFNRFAQQQEAIAWREANKVTTKGLPGIGGTQFSLDAPGFGNALKEALHRDPGTLLFAEVVGGIGEGMSVATTHQAWVDRLAKRKSQLANILSDAYQGKVKPSVAEAAAKELRSVEFAEKLTPVPIIDGEVTTLAHAEAYDGWYEPVVKANKEDGFGYWEAKDPTGRSLGVTIDSDLSILIDDMPKVTAESLASADQFTMLRLYRVAGEALKDFKTTGRVMEVPDKPNWFQLDMAEELLRATNNPKAVKFPGGMTRESAMIESLAQKADAVGKLEQVADDVLAAKLRIRLNLPRLTAYESGLLGTTEHPIDVLFRGSRTGATIRNTTLPELIQAVSEAARAADINSTTKLKVENLTGNSFNFMTDSKGNPTKVIMTYKRPFTQESWLKDNLNERLAQRKVATLAELASPMADKASQTIVRNMIQSPDFALASQASSLADVQMSSATPGFGNLAPTGSVRGITDAVSTTEWKFRDNPVMLAVTRLRESAERSAQAFMRETFETAMEDRLAVLNGPRNEASRIMLNAFHSHAGGWHIKAPVGIKQQDGSMRYEFVLEENAENATRWRQQFGTEMPSGATLVDGRGQAIQLDELTFDVQTRFNKITEARRQQANTLRRAMGLSEIRKANFYVPPPEVEGKFIGYVMDSRNQIVPGGTVIANTEEEFTRKLAKMREDKDSMLNKDGYSFRTLKDIKDHANLWDRVQMDMMNPGRTPLAGGFSNLGRNAGPDVNMSAFEESMLTMRNQLTQHGRDLMEIMLKDQIDAAKARAEISGTGVARNAGREESKQRNRTIYDYYVQEALGRRPLNSDKSWVGRLFNMAEARGDSLLAAGATKTRNAVESAKMYLSQANPYRLTDKEKSAFDELTKQLGEAMPFKSAVEYMESKGYKAPPTLASITGNISRFEATWVLRMFEVMQASMNMLGMVNAAPSVIRHLGRGVAETAEEYAARVGHSAQIFTSPTGKSHGVMDMAKLTYRGFKRAWAKEADEEYARIAAKGMASQEVAEFQKAFNAAEIRSGYDLFMNGDPRSASKFGQKGLVGWLSVLSDKSEDFSRTWGHFIGLEIAKDLGIQNIDAADNFAHDVANKMIANYSPHNRTEIFQGAIGAPIGLFMSFIQAYYQRLFRYAETGDFASLATQYAMQQGIFGMQTIPGYAEAVSLMQSTGEDKLPYDSIVQRFGQETGDLLMAGVIGNLPKIFGLDGIDFASRGGTEVRLPVVAQAPAVVTTAKKIYQGIGQAVDMFSDKSPEMSGQQVAEILSNTIPNRPIAGFIEQAFAGGLDVDSTGQVATQALTGMDVAARVLGTRTTRQTAELQAFYANKQAQEIKASRDEILRRNTRALIRDGASAEDLEATFAQYVENGGDPRRYKRWIRDQFEAALETRGERQLRETLRNPAREAESRRLLNAYVSIGAEESEPEFDAESTNQEMIIGDAMPGNFYAPTQF